MKIKRKKWMSAVLQRPLFQKSGSVITGLIVVWPEVQSLHPRGTHRHCEGEGSGAVPLSPTYTSLL